MAIGSSFSRTRFMRASGAHACALALLAAGCSGEAEVASPEKAGPLWPTADGFVSRTPEQQGMDAAILEGAREYALQDGKNTQALIVIRRGALVAQWYAEGADRASFAPSWSMAKSFASALIGIAIEEGLIPGVDVSMADYFPDWKGTAKEQIRLRDVLQMSSGLDWNENYDPASAAASDIIQLVLSEGSHLEYAAARNAAFDPGTRFNYSSGDSMLLSGVLEAATGKTAAEYGKEKLFDPLGMDPVDWWQDSAGNTLTYCCLDTTSEDFARFGLLYLRGGLWRDAQVVPSAWIADSIEPSPANDGYGYKWWLTGITKDVLPGDTFSARGHDGQYIYVIPSLELVVVRNGKYIKYDGPPAADPVLFTRYPSDGLVPDLGSFPPDSWDDVELLTPILESITDG